MQGANASIGTKSPRNDVDLEKQQQQHLWEPATGGFTCEFLCSSCSGVSGASPPLQHPKERLKYPGAVLQCREGGCLPGHPQHVRQREGASLVEVRLVHRPPEYQNSRQP